ncbi:hypothetical protein A2U01_0048850 [Trifolium medium]|uniref:Uncharacterized protein n=1 Tax=Trifolium medium TaxID=97028 RepID=A0A392QVP3_9FABA|nr:hypothetical protein [Trifolium medium]
MAANNYNTAEMIDWPLPPYGLELMTAIQEYRTQHPTPSYCSSILSRAILRPTFRYNMRG